MTHHINKKLGIEFDTPDSFTVREQLAYISILHSRDDDSETYTTQWQAALPLIRNWKCEWMPDPTAFDFDKPMTHARDSMSILWASGVVYNSVMGLEILPKDLSGSASSVPAGEATPPPN